MRPIRTTPDAPNWAQMLVDAVNTPGVLSDAYRRFWNFSIGNQLMAIFECLQRGIPPGPIHTFRGWLDLGRHVKKGEKAITLCMPVTVKAKRKCTVSSTEKSTADDSEDAPTSITIFVYKPHWFVLCQTDGDSYVPTELPDWSETRCLETLKIERVEFRHPDGNCQGYASGQSVAISPVAVLPHKTLFHELAHVALGHTAASMMDDHERTPVNLREVEAECVALICCATLERPGVPECRGYIQHWLGTGTPIPDRSAQRIFKTADAILKAGRSVALGTSDGQS